MPTQTVAIAGPMTYMVDGVQYIAVNVGWGGSPVAGLSRENPPVRFGPARLLVFRLDAKGVELPPMPPPAEIPPPPPLRASEEQIRSGRRIFGETCSRCHGENAVGGLKDLRWMTAETRRQFATIVLDSTPALREKGMQPFRDLLTQADVDALNAYLVARANEDYQDHIAGGPQ
jgi:quinohemoprotein ethanol dehydrogenase